MVGMCFLSTVPGTAFVKKSSSLGLFGTALSCTSPRCFCHPRPMRWAKALAALCNSTVRNTSPPSVSMKPKDFFPMPHSVCCAPLL
eukprot:5383153-Amphidinium_carterae.1